MYVKTAYHTNPLFADSKVILSVYKDRFKGKIREMDRYMALSGLDKKSMKPYRKGQWKDLMLGAVAYSDAFIQGSETIDPEVAAVIKASGKPFLPYIPTDTEEYIDIYNDFYDSILPLNEEDEF